MVENNEEREGQYGHVITVHQRVLVHGVSGEQDAYDEYLNHGRSEHSGVIEILKEDYDDLGPWTGDDDPVDPADDPDRDYTKSPYDAAMEDPESER
jgi:hypothetical protein